MVRIECNFGLGVWSSDVSGSGDNLLFLLGLAIFKKKKAEIMKLTADDWDEYWTRRKYLENLHFQDLLSDLNPNLLASEINSLRLYHRAQVLRESVVKPVPDRDVLASKYKFSVDEIQRLWGRLEARRRACVQGR